MHHVRSAHHGPKKNHRLDSRTRLFCVAILFFVGLVGLRLFYLQVISYSFYSTLASGQHDIYQELYPNRGSIYVRDPKTPEGIFPVAINKTVYEVAANPTQVKNPQQAAADIATDLDLDVPTLVEKLSRKGTAYVVLQKTVPEERVSHLKELNVAGLSYSPTRYRFYPEKNDAAHVTGFVGLDPQGNYVGRYGIEGYWEKTLAGRPGSLATEKDPLGRWIGAAKRTIHPAVDGSDLVLTIDRTIQEIGCQKLRAAVEKHQAASGSLVIINPKTGAVLAMCSVPDFDPNSYASTADVSAFNNTAIFTPYEPGSIFKSVTMAAAIDAGKVTPSTTYTDTGKEVIGPFTIKNAEGGARGVQTMTQALEKSLNTGMIFAVRKLGPQPFAQYVKDFGFGAATGIELDTESKGNVSSLDNRGDIWSATGSFGQGITVTPLQMADAYASIANGGKLMRPYIVDEIRDPDGSVQHTAPQVVRQVLTSRAAALTSGMLVGVVEEGLGKRAAVHGYWVAGKTGTAQISKNGIYQTDIANGSFAGFAPVDNPAFAMVVKLEQPKDVLWAESSAAPLFGDIASFLLQYLEIPPERK